MKELHGFGLHRQFSALQSDPLLGPGQIGNFQNSLSLRIFPKNNKVTNFFLRCECKLGRRRPFIIGLSIVAIFGLTMLTFAPSFADIFQSNLSGLIIAIVGSQLMDWGLDSTEERFELLNR